MSIRGGGWDATRCKTQIPEMGGGKPHERRTVAERKKGRFYWEGSHGAWIKKDIYAYKRGKTKHPVTKRKNECVFGGPKGRASRR